MSDLLPCPFCGAKPHHGLTKIMHCQLHGDPYQNFRIWCPHKCAQVECGDETRAAKKWNTRVAYHPVTSSPVVDHETGNMSDKLRDAMEVYIDARNAFGRHKAYSTAYKAAAAVIEADRQAAIAAIDLPGQREAAARAALEAAASIEESRSWSAGLKAHEIRAIDPAAFRGGNDATS